MLFLVRFPRTPAVTLDILDPALFSGWPGPWTACVVILGRRRRALASSHVSVAFVLTTFLKPGVNIFFGDCRNHLALASTRLPPSPLDHSIYTQ